MDKIKTEKILVGNTFPLAMVKREVRIYPISLESLRKRVLGAAEICSYWGHANTEHVAQEILGVKFPAEDFRKPLSLSPRGYPMWGNAEFKKCHVLSPDYRNGFRPSINKEVTPDEILSWKALVLEWI